jgi:thiamine-monophosphate kinase
MNLSDLGEAGLLDLFRDWTGGATGHVLLGPGDDAALLKPSGTREIVVSTDAYVEGVHFRREYLAPDEIGQRVMTGALSDLAAMGAEGHAAFVNVHAPPDTEVEFLRRVYLGLDRIADSCGVVIAGGDTVRGELAFDVTVLGSVEPGQAWRRQGALAGDVICVSGELGASEMGRRLLAGEVRESLPAAVRAQAEAAHRSPRPRFDVSRLLGRLERRTVDVELERETVEPVRPHAVIDISDGLGIDLVRLCEASHVGCRLEARQIPVHPAARRIARLQKLPETELVLGCGEDHELLFTISEADVELMLEAARKASIRIAPIGQIVPVRDGRHLVTESGAQEPLEPRGWDHFTPNRAAR